MKQVAEHGPRTGFRSDIEGLRGIAVLMVVLYHVGVPGWGGGFIGVDVFFVLSGYLITGLLVKEIENKGRLDLLQFYSRRARRLLPASALVVIVTVIAGMIVFSPLEQADFARTALATAAYMSNVLFMIQSSNYFGVAAETNPLLHTWSLAVEEQFYLVWPLVILFGLRARSRARLAVLIVALSVLSLGAAEWLLRYQQPWAFFGSPSRAWEFGLGGLASLIPASALKGRLALCWTAGWIGILVVVGSGVWFTSTMPVPGGVMMIPVIGTVAVLLAGVAGPGLGVARVLNTSVLQYCGRLSYSWYLWHWPVLVLVTAVVPLSLPGRIVCGVASLVLAAATHAAVENPIRFSKRLVPRPALSLGLSAVVTIFSILVATGWRHSALQAADLPKHRIYSSAANDKPGMHAEGCMVRSGIAEPRPCVFGNAASPTTIVLFGDSHASRWFPALDEIAQARGWRLVTMVKSACPSADIPNSSRSAPRHAEQCARWREESLKWIVQQDPDLVVVGNSSGYAKGGVDGERSPITTAEWQAGYSSLAASLNTAGIRMLLMRNPPAADFDVPRCLSRAAHQSWNRKASCAIQRDEAFGDSVYVALRDAAEEFDNVHLADLSDQFCEVDQCSFMKDGVVVLSDSHHLTVDIVRRITPILDRQIGLLVPGT